MSSSEPKKDGEAFADLTATVNRVKSVNNTRQLLTRVMLAKAATLSDAQLLTLMYAVKAPSKDRKSLIPT
jgi:hypothetical protein